MEVDTIIVAALIAAGPTTVTWLAGKQRAREKREDWAREDAVREQTAEAAELLIASQHRQEEIQLTTLQTVEQVHTLVNSNFTAALAAQLDETESSLILMKEVSALHQAAGTAPSVEAVTAIDAKEAKVAELRATLADRTAAQATVDAKVED